MATLSIDAPTIRSMSAASNCSGLGFIINCPSRRATRTSEIGPSKGISDNDKQAEAARPARASGIQSLS